MRQVYVMFGKYIDKIFLILGLLIVSSILLFGEYGVTRSTYEDKDLTPLPTVFITHEIFPSSMEKYINDRFGLRKYFIAMYDKISALDSWSFDISGRCVFGKEGWLFANIALQSKGIETYETITNFQGREEFTNKDLKAVVDNITAVDLWAKENGINFIVVFPPMKFTIYPDYFSSVYGKYKDIYRYEKVVSALIDAGVDVVDVKPRLMKEAHNQLLFYRQDAHWTSYAAYIAYGVMMEKIKKYSPDAHFVPRNDVIFKESDYFTPDVMYVKKGSHLPYLDKKVVPVFNDNIIVKYPDIQLSGLDSEVINHLSATNVNDTKVFLIRDSFSNDLIPFLERSVGRLAASRLLWGKSPLIFKDIILKEKPDILILEMQERYLKLIANGSFSKTADL